MSGSSGTKTNTSELVRRVCTHSNSRKALKDSWKPAALNQMIIYFTCDRWCILRVKNLIVGNGNGCCFGFGEHGVDSVGMH